MSVPTEARGEGAFAGCKVQYCLRRSCAVTPALARKVLVQRRYHTMKQLGHGDDVLRAIGSMPQPGACPNSAHRRSMGRGGWRAARTVSRILTQPAVCHGAMTRICMHASLAFSARLGRNGEQHVACCRRGCSVDRSYGSSGSGRTLMHWVMPTTHSDPGAPWVRMVWAVGLSKQLPGHIPPLSAITLLGLPLQPPVHGRCCQCVIQGYILISLYYRGGKAGSTALLSVCHATLLLQVIMHVHNHRIMHVHNHIH